ncbi:permease [Acrocarpospora phusangensis]|uniref:Permease n=1 Tax=Acrocarpospora phusangensis TaxID=1070424 RepID=A0A919QI22_9ACTN|nr:DMT family transporter [Acrocarpospora phusangensis]GIH26800.1 permease [Acrocarpospora phusangensis]
MNRTYLAGIACLVSVTAIWGSTFPLTKDLLLRLPVADLYAVRFAIAVAVLVAIRPKALAGLSRRTWLTGVALGLVYGAALVVQTFALIELPSSVSGFVTGSYLVLTPLLAWLWTRHAPERSTWLAVALATAGMAAFTLLSGGDAGGVIEAGPVALTLLSAVLYAVHIVALGRWSSPAEAYPLAIIQILTLTVIMWVAAAPGGVALPASAGDWAGVLYLATIAGAFTFLAQTWAQAHVPPTAAAVVISAEPLWATGFAFALYGEALTWPVLVGGTCVVAAMILVAWPRREATVPDWLPEEATCPASPVPPGH